MPTVNIIFFRNLPAKPAEEAQKHRQQYEEMVVQAKKRGDGISCLQIQKV